VGSPQDLIAGRYRLQRRIAAGGMGVVWEARDELLQRAVAVKQLRLQAGVSEDEADLAKQRAMREARITARLHHPNAVPVFDAVEHDGEPCLVMQYVPSEPLSALMKHRGPLPIGETVRIGAQVAAALAAAHALGIVHRDVKPGNILIADDDGTALLSDFGISHALGDATLTSTGFVHGTPAYLAPEVARGDQSTFASDVFSLGSTLYTASEGRTPFGEEPNSIAVLHRVASGSFQAPGRGGPLAALLLQMMASDPEARPTMREIARRLEAMQVEIGDEPAPTLPLVSAEDPRDDVTEEAPDDEDQPTAWVPVPTDEPATLVAEAAGASVTVTRQAPTAIAPSSPPPPDPPTEEVAPRPSRERSRRPLVLGAVVTLLLLALAGLGVRMLVTADPGTPTRSATAAATGRSAAASPSASASATSSPAPTATVAPSLAPTASPTPTPTATATTVPGNGSAASPVAAIQRYYSLVPNDLADAWPLMTTSYQSDHAGGRQAYDRFWAPVRTVTATRVRATGTNRVEATITYHYDDGRVTAEDTVFQLVRVDGVLKIADSSVVGSG
jgi:serine/threonine protein kinase